MTPEPVLMHIGYHKTGTSWLQSHLFSRNTMGFYPLGAYDRSELPSGDKVLPKHLTGYFYGDGAQLLSPFEDRTEEFLVAIRSVVIPEGAMGVLSNERLTGNPHEGGTDSRYIADRIQKALPKARILVCIREQLSMILSSYFQYLKTGGTISIEDYIKISRNAIIPGVSLNYYRYDRLVRYYMDLFGKEAVLVLPFELFCAEPEIFVKAITDFCGVPVLKTLPFQLRSNVENKRVKVARHYLRPLIAGRSSILAGRMHSAFLKAANIFVPEKLCLKKFRYFENLIKTSVDGYFTESNHMTSELISIDLIDQYGYR